MEEKWSGSTETAAVEEMAEPSLEQWTQLGQQALAGSARGEVALEDAMRAAEAQIVRHVWEQHGRNVTATAKALQTSRRRVRSALSPRRLAKRPRSTHDPALH